MNPRADILCGDCVHYERTSPSYLSLHESGGYPYTYGVCERFRSSPIPRKSNESCGHGQAKGEAVRYA